MNITNFKQQNALASFKKIMNFKGEIAPIAEKACRNFELKTKRKGNYQHLYYFTVGHTIKSMLNNKQIFNRKIEDGSFQKFKTLEEATFVKVFCERLETVETVEKENNGKIKKEREYRGLLPNIRNLNNHYAHCFNGVKLDTQTDKPIVDFLMDCFHVAIIQVYLDENNIKYEDFDKIEKQSDKLKEFLFEKFVNKTNRDYWEEIKTLTLFDAINAILFADVESEFSFKITKTISLQITPGKYLSFYGCLFLLMLFMYKDEAELLISQIKGFKKNKEKDEQSKRNLFTYFCKKTSSRDTNIETPDLVNFREIMLYINKYPTQWNKEYEIEVDKTESLLLKQLKDKLIEMDIDKMFFRDAEYRDADKNALEETRKRFQIFAKHEIWNQNKKQRQKTDYTSQEQDKFYKLIHDHSLQRDAEGKLNIIRQLKTNKSYDTEIERLNKIITDCNAENKTSEELKKIQDRLNNNLYYASQGRNQDAFMDYAMRFLAETNYFGQNAKFKMYEFYSPEQDRAEKLYRKDNWPKDKFDKIKLHNGKMTDFFSWLDYQAKGQEWYFPFVIQNNAAQVVLNLDKGEKLVNIQIDLIVYFLQHAFDNVEKGIEGKGIDLINAYYQAHQKEIDEKLTTLQHIPSEEKAQYKKLFPKRLLQRASPDVFVSNRNSNHLQELLDKTEDAEARYIALYKRAVDKVQFEKNNKGKQFKLSFMRSAWNWMYFKDIYKQQFENENKHHKRFHITRDEFNDFSRLLFGLDTNLQYCKEELGKLFRSKRFFDNKEFESLFLSAESFNQLYDKTKEKYALWVKYQSIKPKGSYSLESYTKKDKPKEEPILGGKIFYINTSHFAAYLKDKCNWPQTETGVARFVLMEQNAQYLIAEFYANTAQNKDKNSRKAYYETKREDSLLYEIALYSLRQEFSKQSKAFEKSLDVILKQKKNITEILTQTVLYPIVKGTEQLYEIFVPINNLDSFLESVARKEEDEQLRSNSSFMANIYSYLKMIWNEIPKEKQIGEKESVTHKDLYPICKRFFKDSKTVLTYNEYLLVNKSLLRSSNLLTEIAMKLEKHSLSKRKLSMPVANKHTACSFVKPEEAIEQVGKYFGTDSMRNKAAHFLVPTTNSYQKQLQIIAAEFANRYLKNKEIGAFDKIDKAELDICRFLAEVIYKDKIGFVNGKKDNVIAHNCFFNNYISKN